MQSYLVLSAVVFGAVACVHLLRLIFGWPAQVGELAVPLWISVPGLLGPGALCIWALALARGLRGA
jgi:hypothetical protein